MFHYKCIYTGMNGNEWSETRIVLLRVKMVILLAVSVSTPHAVRVTNGLDLNTWLLLSVTHLIYCTTKKTQQY